MRKELKLSADPSKITTLETTGATQIIFDMVCNNVIDLAYISCDMFNNFLTIIRRDSELLRFFMKVLLGNAMQCVSYALL